MKWKWIYNDIVCIAFLFLFFYSGLIKLAKMDQFESWIKSAFLLNEFPSILKYAIPLFEMLIGIGFIFKTSRIATLYMSFWSCIICCIYIMVLSIYKIDRFFPFTGVYDRYITWTTELICMLIAIGLLFTLIVINEGKKGEEEQVSY